MLRVAGRSLSNWQSWRPDMPGMATSLTTASGSLDSRIESASAAELANSTADMILISESLALVTVARNTARLARKLIRQNLSWAVLYNAAVMPLAVSAMLKPWMAALGMSLSSLLVVANAARLVKQPATGTDTVSSAETRAKLS